MAGHVAVDRSKYRAARPAGALRPVSRRLIRGLWGIDRRNMNAALWKKTFYESRWLLLGSMAFMFAVHWLRVWISSFFSTSAMEGMLSFMPELVETLMPVSFAQIATSAGRIAVAYDDPIVLLLITVWGISR